MRFWRWLYDQLKSETARFIGRVGLLAILVALVSYWVSYEDRVASRHESAWATLREAITWIESSAHRSGNVGQIGAIQTLVRDCGHWWRGTPLQSVFDLFFPDCVDVKALVLERMELGGLRADGANLSYVDFACSNLATASFRRATLTGANFSAANLAGADFRGAILTGRDPGADADFRLADLSEAQFDATTVVKPEQLSCACIDYRPGNDGTPRPMFDEEKVKPYEVREVVRKLQKCPLNKCDAETKNAWKCGE